MVKRLAVNSAEGPKETSMSSAPVGAHVLSPSSTRETRRGWLGGVDLAQALNAVLQWLVVNLPPDEFSRQTFLVSDGTPA